MTPEENQALQRLLSQLTQIRGVAKDAQADAMINDAVARQPDAAYLLVQRAMILEQALEAAKARIGELERQLQQSQQANRGFLDANAWGNAGAVTERSAERSVTGAEIPANPSRQSAQNAPPPYSNAPSAVPAAPRPGFPGFFGGGAGSMLGTIAATAAGVAAGSFLFQGIGNLLGNHPGHGIADRIAGTEGAPAQDAAAAFGNLGPADDDALAGNASTDDTATDDDFLADNSDIDDIDDGSLDDSGSYDV